MSDFDNYMIAHIHLYDTYFTVTAYVGGKCTLKITLPREEHLAEVEKLRKQGYAIAYADVF